MNRFAMTAVAVSSAIASPFVAPGAQAQTARDLVGTWTLVSTTTEQGGARIDVFGPDPAGTILFGPDGRYALIFARRDLPRFAANTRPSGTPEENRAVVQGSIAHFGTYSVDEGGKTLVLRIEASTFPNWTGAEQRRPFALRGDQLTYTSPGSIGTPSEVTMRRVK